MKTKGRHSGIAGAKGLAKESSADRALPVLKGVEHRLVDLAELRMHVAEAGSGRPLLLLHGFPQHWWEWRGRLHPEHWRTPTVKPGATSRPLQILPGSD
jgi:hypothetical protein